LRGIPALARIQAAILAVFKYLDKLPPAVAIPIGVAFGAAIGAGASLLEHGFQVVAFAAALGVAVALAATGRPVLK
jgi:hypothetical protein